MSRTLPDAETRPSSRLLPLPQLRRLPIAQPRQKPEEQTAQVQSGCTAVLRGCAKALLVAADRFQRLQGAAKLRSRLLRSTLNEPQPVNPELSTNRSSRRYAKQL